MVRVGGKRIPRAKQQGCLQCGQKQRLLLLWLLWLRLLWCRNPLSRERGLRRKKGVAGTQVHGADGGTEVGVSEGSVSPRLLSLVFLEKGE